MNRRKGRPSTKQQIDHSKVLDIAVKAFAQKGFEGTQMKAIADEAGCAKSLMNYHFKNKDNLWQKSIIHLCEKLILRFEELRSHFKDLEGLPALKAYTRQLIYFSAEYPEFNKLISNEMGLKSERSDWIIENILQPIHLVFEQEDRMRIKGESILENYPVANLASIMIGATNIFFSHAYQMERMYGVNPFDKKEIEQHADIVIDLLFAKFNHKIN
ncbi:MAG: TetR family transcriptional regulator [Bacteroidota bacterium]